MKLQAPSSKLQRSTKHQAPKETGAVVYPNGNPRPWELKDSAEGNDTERHAFDLEERTARLGEALIHFCKKIPHSPENNRLIDQLVGCGTSIGANYCEANEGVSKKDSKYSIGRCVKESKETKFFIRMVAASEPTLVDEARKLYLEAKELHLIFDSMYRK